MWNFSLFKALRLWVRVMPLLLTRLAVFTAIALSLWGAALAGAWVAGAGWLSDDPADPVLGALCGLALGAVVAAIARSRLILPSQAALIALTTDIADGLQVPFGPGQIAHARAVGAARFGTGADLRALDRLVRRAAGVIPAVAEGLGRVLSAPLIGRLATGGLGDQAVLAHAYRARPENAWEASHDGIVLVAQNAHDLMGTAGRINGVGWLVTAGVFVLLLQPLAALATVWPGQGAEAGFLAAALAAWAIRAALVQPFQLACFWQAFLRLTAGQEPLGEWRGRLTQVSGPFRHLGDQAVTWAPATGATA